VARRAGEVWQLEHRRFLRWSKSGAWASVATALAQTMAESGHYNIDNTTVRAHVSAAGGKGGFINELLAARGAGSPVKFTVSVMRDDPSPSSLRREKRPTARSTKP
jgi:hypothetical protein